MPNQAPLLEASSRVALAAYLHDLGKFAERAALQEDRERIEIHEQSYCRRHEAGGKQWYSHKHAAWTALAWDLIENQFPELVGEDVAPFAAWGDRDADDSVVNAAARHHKPETPLQWIVATADRVASGFEREEFQGYNDQSAESALGHDHFTTRLLTLFEGIRLDSTHQKRADWRYPLKPLSVETLFPQLASECEGKDRNKASAEYRSLWETFKKSLQAIPKSHRGQWPLWLDHFDSAWSAFTQAIPSATWKVKAEVSLYDHSHTTAALATALWRYHHDRGDDLAETGKALADFQRPDWGDDKFLLIQGDFFGIQDFIFATGGETQRQAARLLRGRSFYVSLLTECAALKILETLALPPTSQITNAAGKFLIVAPNTDETRAGLDQVRRELDQWFLLHTHGIAGIGLAAQPAACNDFLSGKSDGESPFQKLITRLFDQLQDAKARRFDLCGQQPPAPVFDGFLDAFEQNQKGVCAIDGRSPATASIPNTSGKYACDLALDQIRVGKQLAHRQRLLISRSALPGNDEQGLRIPIFGYHVYFTDAEEISGKFGEQANNGNLRRAWDFGLPEEKTDTLFRGYAKRFINGYVPTFGDLNIYESGRYAGIEADDQLAPHPDEPKTLTHIAHDDLLLDKDDHFKGARALSVLKGDVDNLGRIFESGLARPTFAKMSALSRQMNQFFAVWLPWHCANHAPSTYTVFAGGDDFFLIGPWKSTMKLAADMRKAFTAYVAQNPEIHFSAGLAMVKPKLPIRALGEMGEEALEKAKKRTGKDGVTAFKYTVGWSEFDQLFDHAATLDQLASEFNLSTGYVYGLQYLADMAEDLVSGNARLESSLWRSRFAYRTRRMLERARNMDKEERNRRQGQLTSEIVKPIEIYRGAYKVALFTHLYQKRS